VSRGCDFTPESLRSRLALDDARLLAECEIHLHRSSGPGGQHRNKVASAVRLVHRPTGFVVTATERRSQHENKSRALQRLREAIAIGVRCPPTGEIVWPPSVKVADGRLRVSEKNPGYWAVLALVLDELAASAGELGPVASRLGVTASSLTRLLAGNPKAWAEANRLRASAGHKPLRS
jgi:RF-1 domain